MQVIDYDEMTVTVKYNFDKGAPPPPVAVVETGLRAGWGGMWGRSPRAGNQEPPPPDRRVAVGGSMAGLGTIIA